MSLAIEVVNVGPIRRAQLSPGNLNVLIGTNDTGKTFLATVVHRLFASRTEAYYPDRQPTRDMPERIPEYVGEIQAALRRNNGRASFPDLLIDDTMHEWANRINESTLKRYGRAARYRISYAYGVPIEHLRRRPVLYSENDSYITITNSSRPWSIKIPIQNTEKSYDPIVTCPDPEDWIRDVYSPDNIQRLSSIFESVQSTDKDSEVTPKQYIEELCQYILYMTGDIRLFDGWPRSCLHLPSERGGIMQSYRAITSAALRKSSLAGIEPIEIEPLDGTSRDFLSFVVSPTRPFHHTEGSEYIDLAKSLEEKMRARIDIVESQSGVDRIVATTPEGQFELNQTSSMISEISAFVLALGHRLRSRDYLTIDEPEAHLHPEMQIEIARLLVYLASTGLTVTLTTHSDYFIEEINNAIRSSVLMTHGEEEIARSPQIAFEHVRALLFVREDDGCIAREARLNSIDPISEETFTKPSRRQYDESVPLINRLLELEHNANGTSGL